jgi:hypothetical protein
LSKKQFRIRRAKGKTQKAENGNRKLENESWRLAQFPVSIFHFPVSAICRLNCPAVFSATGGDKVLDPCARPATVDVFPKFPSTLSP